MVGSAHPTDSNSLASFRDLNPPKSPLKRGTKIRILVPCLVRFLRGLGDFPRLTPLLKTHRSMTERTNAKRAPLLTDRPYAGESEGRHPAPRWGVWGSEPPDPGSPHQQPNNKH
jgi:hypothetical protein